MCRSEVRSPLEWASVLLAARFDDIDGDVIDGGVIDGGDMNDSDIDKEARELS